MDVGQFSYLLSEAGPRHVKVASDRLELLAKTAAKRYLEERVPLTESITKMAEENDLNANQIERICEMANISTHQALWTKTANKHEVSFPLADAGAIMKHAKPDAESSEDAPPSKGSCGCGSIEADYAGPPKGIPRSGPSLLSMMGADPEKVHHGLGPEPERKRIMIILQKKAHERKALADSVVYKGMELESLEKRAFQAVKQSVLGGASFRDIYAAATASGLSKLAEEYLPQFEERILGEVHGPDRLRLVKEAISRAPEDLIGDVGGATVANGAHPVIISLDVVGKKTDEIKNGLQGLVRIDDEVKVYNQRLRELT